MLKPFVVYFSIREVANEVHAVVIAKDESSARKFAERAMAQSVTLISFTSISLVVLPTSMTLFIVILLNIVFYNFVNTLCSYFGC